MSARQEQKLEKRELIIDAAVRLFEQQGFWNTSTASISKKAGIATGTLFRYFETKEQLIEGVFLDLKQEVADYMYEHVDNKLPVRDRLHTIWRSYISWNLANPEKFVILEQLEIASRISNAVHNQVVDMNQYTVKTMVVGIKEGLIGDYPIEFLANFLGSSSTNIIKQLLSGTNTARTKSKREELIEVGFEVFWNGISA